MRPLALYTYDIHALPLVSLRDDSGACLILRRRGGDMLSHSRTKSWSSIHKLLLFVAAVSTGGCNTGLEFTRRSLKAQGFPWALIEAQGYFV